MGVLRLALFAVLRFGVEMRVGSQASIGLWHALAILLDRLNVLHVDGEVVLDSSAVLAAATLFVCLFPSIVRSRIVEYLVRVVMVGLVVSAFNHKDHELAFSEGIDDFGTVAVVAHDSFFGAGV